MVLELDVRNVDLTFTNAASKLLFVGPSRYKNSQCLLTQSGVARFRVTNSLGGVSTPCNMLR